MAFSCAHCGYRSNEVQYGGNIAEKGVRIEVFKIRTGSSITQIKA